MSFALRPGPSVDATPAMTIARAIDEASIGSVQLLVVGLCFLVSALDGLDLQALSFAAPSVVRDLHLPAARLGPIFSATLLGSIAGSYLGVLADRFGRKPLVVASVVIFSTFTLACGMTRSFGELALCRGLAGIGMGGAVPSMVALASEITPARWRSRAVTVVLCGFPVGAMIGGAIASVLVTSLGWRALFFVGAAASGALVPALVFACPESPRFSALMRPNDPALQRLLARLRPDLRGSRLLTSTGQDLGSIRAARPRFDRAGLTAIGLLSAAGFFSLLLQYLMSNWTPLLLQRAGFPVRTAIFGGVLFNLGALLGSAALSAFVSGRGRGAAALAGAFLLGGGCILVAAAGRGRPALELLALAAFGFFQFGAQIGATNYGQFFFATAQRGAALAWIGAVSRLGALAGPMAGGLLVELGLPTDKVFRLGVIPAVLAATALGALTWIRPAPPAPT